MKFSRVITQPPLLIFTKANNAAIPTNGNPKGMQCIKKVSRNNDTILTNKSPIAVPTDIINTSLTERLNTNFSSSFAENGTG